MIRLERSTGTTQFSFLRRYAVLASSIWVQMRHTYYFHLPASLEKLDLQYMFLSTEDHCQLLQWCPNLEVLQLRNVIGDRGLEVVAQTCKKLQRLRIERGDDVQGLEDEQGRVTQVGLLTLAQGCPELEYLAVYASDITNVALESLGNFHKILCDFRLVLLD